MKTIKATSLRIPASVFGLALMIGTPVQAQSRFPRLPFAEARAPRVAGGGGRWGARPRGAISSGSNLPAISRHSYKNGCNRSTISGRSRSSWHSFSAIPPIFALMPR
jgi:hypothetical protein